MAKKRFFVGMLVMVLAFGMTVVGCEDVIQDEGPFPMRGSWILTDKGDGTYTSTVLVVTQLNGNNFEGYFDWNSTANTQFGKHYWGREYFNGIYSPITKKITLTGYRLANVHSVTIGLTTYSLILGNYDAYVADNGVDFIQGTDSGGGRWEAKLKQ